MGNFYFTFPITLSFKIDFFFKSPFISLSFKMGGHFPQRMLNTHPPGFVGVIVSHLHGYMLFTLIVVQHYLLSHKKEVMFVMVLLAIFKLRTYQ
jgi:hypothetical protein